MLYGVPGYRKWAKVAPQDFMQNLATISPPAGIHDMVAIDTAAYGCRLFGISSQYQFFEIRLGENAGDMDPMYDPEDAGDPLYETPASRIHQFTLEDSERVNGRARLRSDGRHILWVQRRAVKVWDVEDSAFVPVTVPVPDDFSSLPDEEFVDATFISGYWVLVSRGGQFFHSNLNGLTFSQLEFASAEQKRDPNVACEELNGQLFIFGTRSVERWFNSGGVDFGFERDNSFRTETGCAHINTLEKIKGSLVWVAEDRSVWAIGDVVGGGPGAVRVSTAAADYDIQRSDITKARAWGYIEEGHRFYNLVLTMRDGTERTWTYDLDTNYWHERSSQDILCAVSFIDRTLVGRAGSEYIQDMRLDYGRFDGELITREAITPTIDAGQRRVRAHLFQVEVPKRPPEVVGDFDGDDFYGRDFQFGSKNDIMTLEWTDDGGETWKDGGRDPKPLDDRILRWTALGQFRLGRRFRIRTSASRRVQILGAALKYDMGQP